MVETKDGMEKNIMCVLIEAGLHGGNLRWACANKLLFRTGIQTLLGDSKTPTELCAVFLADSTPFICSPKPDKWNGKWTTRWLKIPRSFPQPNADLVRDMRLLSIGGCWTLCTQPGVGGLTMVNPHHKENKRPDDIELDSPVPWCQLAVALGVIGFGEDGEAQFLLGEDDEETSNKIGLNLFRKEYVERNKSF